MFPRAEEWHDVACEGHGRAVPAALRQPRKHLVSAGEMLGTSTLERIRTAKLRQQHTHNWRSETAPLCELEELKVVWISEEGTEQNVFWSGRFLNF